MGTQQEEAEEEACLGQGSLPLLAEPGWPEPPEEGEGTRPEEVNTFPRRAGFRGGAHSWARSIVPGDLSLFCARAICSRGFIPRRPREKGSQQQARRGLWWHEEIGRWNRTSQDSLASSDTPSKGPVPLSVSHASQDPVPQRAWPRAGYHHRVAHPERDSQPSACL